LNDDFAASEGIVAGLAVAGVRVLGQPYPLAVGLQGAPAPGEDVAQRPDGEAVGLVDGVELVFAALTPPGQHDQQERHIPRAHGVRVQRVLGIRHLLHCGDWHDLLISCSPI
jgi:hypothetical protein